MTLYYQDNSGVLYQGDVLAVLKEFPAESISALKFQSIIAPWRPSA